MNLHLCIDGAIEDTFPLIDANDPFNAAAERTAFDKAYEAKESCPDAVVTILVDLEVDGDERVITDGDLDAAAFALETLADIDEGQDNVDGDELRRLAAKFRTQTDSVVDYNGNGLAPGTRVKLARDVERYPHFIAEAGLVGTVIDVGDRQIVLAVKLDDRLPGAEDWDNEVLWQDVQLAEALEDVEVIHDHLSTEGWSELFDGLRRLRGPRDSELVEQAIDLIRTHAVDAENPLALD